MKKKNNISEFIICFAAFLFLFFMIVGNNMEKESDIANADNSNSIPIQTVPPVPVSTHPGATKTQPKVDKIWRKVPKGCEINFKAIKKAFNPKDVRTATLQRINARHSGMFNIGQVADISDFVNTQWKYFNDPFRSQHLFSASESLNILSGDCDDYAILIGSMVQSIGGEVRITYSCNNTECHAYAEVNLGKTPADDIKNYLMRRYNLTDIRQIGRRLDGNGDFWLNLDYLNGKHLGNAYFKELSGYRFYPKRDYCHSFIAPASAEIIHP